MNPAVGLEPGPIGISGNVGRPTGTGCAITKLSDGTKPAMEFRVAIRKINSRGVSVISAGTVAPSAGGGWISVKENKEPVINGKRRFLKDDE